MEIPYRVIFFNRSKRKQKIEAKSILSFIRLDAHFRDFTKAVGQGSRAKRKMDDVMPVFLALLKKYAEAIHKEGFLKRLNFRNKCVWK